MRKVSNWIRKQRTPITIGTFLMGEKVTVIVRLPTSTRKSS